jgi:hypothetical protein
MAYGAITAFMQPSNPTPEEAARGAVDLIKKAIAEDRLYELMLEEAKEVFAMKARIAELEEINLRNLAALNQEMGL